MITIETTINAPIAKVWTYYTEPEHITKWNFASDDWHTPHAENDLRVGGKFLSRMAAKDGSFGFDFEGVYDRVVPHELIAYSLGDTRHVEMRFSTEGDTTKISGAFDPEHTNTVEQQKSGWQSILNNFKRYVESN